MTNKNNDQYQLRGYLVKARSIASIRQSATQSAKILKLTEAKPDLGQFLEKLYLVGITIDVVEDNTEELFSNGVEASCIPEIATIFLTENTYQKAIQNDPRTRFTIFHELGHFILSHSKILHRDKPVNKDIRPYEDSEWQADQFAAEITMPLDEILSKKIVTTNQIQQHFGVSEAAANRRFKQLKMKGLL